MREIETDEQREKALEWMVQTARELDHPLITVDEKEKKQKVYDYVSDQVQQYNKKLFAGSEYPPAEESMDSKNIDLSDWL